MPKNDIVIINEFSKKNVEIQTLDTYTKPPDSSYWKYWPKTKLPTQSCENQGINVANLNKVISETTFSQSEKVLALRVLETATNGTDTGIEHRSLAPFDVSGGGFIDNPQVGMQLADSLVTMIKKGFVAGPFPFSPISNPRINLMFPLIQPDKCRMILNLSYPPGNSFNDSVPQGFLRKVTMTSAPHVGELIKRCHGQAVLSKYDHVAAYKMIPCKISDLRLQGFRFLNNYFYELRQIFGATPAVNSYDDLHMLMVTIAVKRMKTIINPYFLPRILDDLIGIFTSRSTLQEFDSVYTNLAKEIDVKLAPAVGTKAYIEVDEGLALGINFNCKELTWGLPKSKIDKYISKISVILEQKYVSIKQLQEINGVINYIVSMSPFLRFFRHHIMSEEHRANCDKNKQIALTFHARLQLIIWLRIINDAVNFPLPCRDKIPPFNAICILADASGKPSNTTSSNVKSAAAAVSYILGYPNNILKVCQAFFNDSLVTDQTDMTGVRFGDKSMFLELLSLLLGIIHNRHMIAKRQVVLLSDNLSAIWALEKGRSTTCLYSSTITLAIATILQSLQTFFYVQHAPRLKSYPSLIADSLTRDDKCGKSYSQIFSNKLSIGWPKELEEWLRNPYLDDLLGFRIWQEISNIQQVLPFSWKNETGGLIFRKPFLPLGQLEDENYERG